MVFISLGGPGEGEVAGEIARHGEPHLVVDECLEETDGLSIYGHPGRIGNGATIPEEKHDGCTGWGVGGVREVTLS